MDFLITAALGMKALWLTYAWLLSCVACGSLARRKGYSERLGVATGFALAIVGVAIWVAWPQRRSDA